MLSVSASQYRVIDVNGEKKEVEASTAYEAFRMAGLKDAIKIERVSTKLNTFIIAKGQFTEDAQQEAESQPQQITEEIPEYTKLLKNSVLSADDMDLIMRSLSEQAAKLASAAPAANEAAPATSASGTEVHGDGFDEIIPAGGAAKPAAKPAVSEIPAAAQAAVTPAEAAAPPVPEKELSPEEVEKLLNAPKS